MTNPFEEHATKACYYPDDFVGMPPVRLVSEAPVPADEVPHDEAKFGDWIEVRVGKADSASKAWMACPRALSKSLGVKEAEPGHLFEVTEAKRGNEDHSPWKLRVDHDP